jgi:N-formylglutamate deformylase
LALVNEVLPDSERLRHPRGYDVTTAHGALPSEVAMPDDGSFEVLPPDGPPAPIVVHVPHASTVVPEDVRAGIVLDDDALAEELRVMTDHRTDVLAAGTGDEGAARFVNRRSRLVVDPERFPDDREELAARGMGAVYTRGHRGQPLRIPDAEAEAALLTRFFHPYADAFATLVTQIVERHGVCTILDVHSYPLAKLPYELHDGPRPPVCVGVDAVHTPAWLTDLVLAEAARHELSTAVDTPFAGAYVPLARYGVDERVTAVMLEIRRDTYLDERTAEPHDGEAHVRAFVTAVGAAIAEHHRDGDPG